MKKLVGSAMYSNMDDVADQLRGQYLDNQVFQFALGARYDEFLRTNKITPFLQAAFWASLQREETQFIRFNIVLLDEIDILVKDNTIDALLGDDLGWNTLRFEGSLEFNPESIIKLAAGVDARQAGLMVDKSNGRIWGIVQFGAALNEVRTFRTASLLSHSVLVIRCDCPATLSIEVGGTPLLRYVRGTVESKERVFILDDDGPVRTFIQDAKMHSRIRQLLAVMRDSNHGGTLCLLPDHSAWTSNAHLDIKYRVLQSSAERLKTNPDHIDFLGSLTKMDGALLVDRDLNVFSFGTFVSGNLAGITAMRSKNANAGQHDLVKYETKTVGARHRSGILFAAYIPDSVVFVVSQDARISCFKNVYVENSDFIIAWSPIGLSKRLNV